MTISLLHAIHAHGDAVCRALEAGDYDEAATLAAERQALVDQLVAAPRPSSLPAAWTDVLEALAEQDRHLKDLAARQDDAFSEALSQTSRHRKAHASYESSSPSTGRLRTVHG